MLRSEDDRFVEMVLIGGEHEERGAVRVPRIPSEVFVEVVRVLIVAMGTALGDATGGGVAAALGACTGYVVGGVVGRRLRIEARRFERRVDGTPAVTLAGGAIGALALASIGVIAGIVPVVLLPGRWGWPVLGIAAWTGLYAGFQVGARKGSELYALLRRNPTPGDTVRLRISKPGREAGQGVGYFDDGSMVVVAGGAARTGELVEAEITTSVPTAKGRLYFATLIG